MEFHRNYHIFACELHEISTFRHLTEDTEAAEAARSATQRSVARRLERRKSRAKQVDFGDFMVIFVEYPIYIYMYIYI